MFVPDSIAICHGTDNVVSAELDAFWHNLWEYNHD
jgi:hypothetical protein